ncbi:hypothetical protein HAX54_023041 [Datura stramonium]|uniref:Uncharacterized protein n=1 Tax=Datura stramonium TaxID=4076 RepID=A0ABS8UX16_DATST|nr:hypothetical protein [Datura stramonium]
MVGAMARRPLSHRILTCHNRETEFSGDLHPINISDTVFSFLDEEGGSSLESVGDDVHVEDEINDEGEENIVEDSQFWETQHQLFCNQYYTRTTTLESQIRSITKETSPSRCWFQLRNLQVKWRSSPIGEHTFIDVVDNWSPKKGEVRVIIELNFRGEFEIAKASEEYNRLVKCLPEVFVGKIERLLSLIKILCNAAKRYEERKCMAPWRKQKYMQAKWLKTSERVTAAKISLPADEYYSNRLPMPRPKASMLTVDLLENFPNLHRTAVEVNCELYGRN